MGMRLSPIYNRDVVWLNDPVSYPLWKKAEQLGAVFNIFLAPHQIRQVADMAQRFPGVNVVIDHFAMMDIPLAALVTGALYFYLRGSHLGFAILTVLAFYA